MQDQITTHQHNKNTKTTESSVGHKQQSQVLDKNNRVKCWTKTTESSVVQKQQSQVLDKNTNETKSEVR